MKKPNPFIYVWCDTCDRYHPCWNPLSGFMGGIMCACYLGTATLVGAIITAVITLWSRHG